MSRGLEAITFQEKQTIMRRMIDHIEVDPSGDEGMLYGVLPLPEKTDALCPSYQWRVASARHGLLVAGLLTCLPAFAADDRPAPQPGLPVPGFELFDLQGNRQALAQYRDPVIVLNFFAYWCDTWVKQLPQLRKLARQQRDLSFRLIAVSVDGQWSDARRKYLRDQALPFAVLLDSRRQLADALGLRRVPTVMVLDRRRQVTYVHEAYPGNPQVLAAIRRVASR